MVWNISFLEALEVRFLPLHRRRAEESYEEDEAYIMEPCLEFGKVLKQLQLFAMDMHVLLLTPSFGITNEVQLSNPLCTGLAYSTRFSDEASFTRTSIVMSRSFIL